MIRIFYFSAGIVLLLDILTKQLVFRTMALGQSIPVFGEWLQWTYIHNAGAAFGLFQGNRWFFVGVSILSVLVLIVLARSPRYRKPWTLLALGLILGGAVGNLLDRLWLGVVIDFVNVGIREHRFPFFNVADSGISVGVALLALQLIREGADPAADGSNESGSVGSEDSSASPAELGLRDPERPAPLRAPEASTDERTRGD